MCDEIDRLRAEVEALREANHQWFTKALDNRKGPRWQQALDSMDERQVPTVLREFWHPAPEEVIIDHG
jgi:hypothetical protein